MTRNGRLLAENEAADLSIIGFELTWNRVCALASVNWNMKWEEKLEKTISSLSALGNMKLRKQPMYVDWVLKNATVNLIVFIKSQ